jgi:hypothetical protein
MSGPKRNPDSLNTIGVVVVGICGAVMVYVSITALQAFYMNDTSEIQTMADYGGQDTNAKSHKADEMRNITEPQMGTPSITIDKAMDLIVRDAAKSPDHLIPALPPSTKATEKAHPGRPEMDIPAAAPTPAPDAAGSGAGSAAPAGAGSGSAAAPEKAEPKADGKKGAAKGAAKADNGSNIQLHTTGSPADSRAPAAGAGGAPAGANKGSANLAPGGHAP